MRTIQTETIKITLSNQPDKRIEEMVSSLTLEEKAGQIFIFSIHEEKPSQSTVQFLQYTHAGGVILMGMRTKNQLLPIVQFLKSVRNPLGLFIAVDEEGGPVRRISDDINPGARILSGKKFSDQCLMWKDTTDLLRGIGFTMNFGIIGDIAYMDSAFIADRSYGSSVNDVSRYVFQTLACSRGILSTIKHFPGHGRTETDSHEKIPDVQITETEWITTDALPFIQAIRSGVDAVMVGHLRFPKIASEPASLSPYFIRKIRSFGHSGLIVTDDMGMLVSQEYPVRDLVINSLHAGSDMIILIGSEEDQILAYETALEEIRNNADLRNDIDLRIRRILEKKAKISLLW